jgi:hypothetical protein
MVRKAISRWLLAGSHPGNCNLLKINKKYVVLLKKNGAFSNKL